MAEFFMPNFQVLFFLSYLNIVMNWYMQTKQYMELIFLYYFCKNFSSIILVQILLLDLEL
jgi:hypothetical protein